jgi:thiamine-phosphate pyrophosphorylase
LLCGHGTVGFEDDETMTLAELARQLNLATPACGLPPLILMSDAARLPDPMSAAAALPKGSAVILRHYEAPGRRDLAVALAGLCRARGLLLLVAGDGRLAARVGAHGLHLPEALVTRAAAWRQRRPDWLITVAAHGRSALMRAARAGADAALLAPVFATLSHPETPPLGVVRFAALVHRSPLPVYALGGINAATMHRLQGSGATGIAAIGALARDG